MKAQTKLFVTYSNMVNDVRPSDDDIYQTKLTIEVDEVLDIRGVFLHINHFYQTRLTVKFVEIFLHIF